MTTAERREQRRRQHVASVCGVLRQYVVDGGEFRLQTVEDEETGELRVTFAIGDREAFRALLEPGSTGSDGADGRTP